MIALGLVPWDEAGFAPLENVFDDLFCLNLIWHAQKDGNSFALLVLTVGNHLNGKWWQLFQGYTWVTPLNTFSTFSLLSQASPTSSSKNITAEWDSESDDVASWSLTFGSQPNTYFSDPLHLSGTPTFVGVKTHYKVTWGPAFCLENSRLDVHPPILAVFESSQTLPLEFSR